MFLANLALMTMVFLLGACATPLSCWQPQQNRNLGQSEKLVLKLRKADTLEGLNSAQSELNEESDPYLIYLYHLKRSELEKDERLKLAFTNYAMELKERWPDQVICEQDL